MNDKERAQLRKLRVDLADARADLEAAFYGDSNDDEHDAAYRLTETVTDVISALDLMTSTVEE